MGFDNISRVMPAQGGIHSFILVCWDVKMNPCLRRGDFDKIAGVTLIR